MATIYGVRMGRKSAIQLTPNRERRAVYHIADLHSESQHTPRIGREDMSTLAIRSWSEVGDHGHDHDHCIMQ